jgi:hypothetical protein
MSSIINQIKYLYGQVKCLQEEIDACCAAPGGSSNWTLADNDIYSNNSGNVGIGNTTPSSKLQVDGGVQMANDADVASASKVGTQRYRSDANNSYVDMCMQTGATTYGWINIVQNNW